MPPWEDQPAIKSIATPTWIVVVMCPVTQTNQRGKCENASAFKLFNQGPKKVIALKQNTCQGVSFLK